MSESGPRPRRSSVGPHRRPKVRKAGRGSAVVTARARQAALRCLWLARTAGHVVIAHPGVLDRLLELARVLVVRRDRQHLGVAVLCELEVVHPTLRVVDVGQQAVVAVALLDADHVADRCTADPALCELCRLVGLAGAALGSVDADQAYRPERLDLDRVAVDDVRDAEAALPRSGGAIVHDAIAVGITDTGKAATGGIPTPTTTVRPAGPVASGQPLALCLAVSALTPEDDDHGRDRRPRVAADRARREAPPPQVDLQLLAGAVSGTPLPMVH